MTILNILVLFVVVGFVLYLINAFIPMEGNVKKLMNIAVVVILLLYVLKGLGFLGVLNTPL